MLTAQQWREERGHIDRVVETDGEAVWILNGEGDPLWELEAYTYDVSTRNLDVTEGTLTVPVVTGDGTVHPLVTAFFGEGFGTDANTILTPGDNLGYMLCVQQPGGIEGRMVSTISYPTLEPGPDGEPATLTFQTMELLGELNFRLAASIPETWGAQPFKRWERDQGKVYKVARELSPIEIATTSWVLTTAPKQTDVVNVKHNVSGPAVERICDVLQNSLDAADRLDGTLDNPAFVVAPGGGRSPIVRIARRDEPVWGTIAETARLAGVGLSCRMWWPGDEPVVTTRGRQSWDRAMGVIRVEAES